MLDKSSAPEPRGADPGPLRRKLGAAWALAVACGLMLATMIGLVPDAPDAWTYDWRTTLLAKRAEEPRRDIAVLLIGEDGIGRYTSRSPIDRHLLATLVTALDKAGAKAIGLDLIFDRTTGAEADAALLTAIKTSRTPIVLGTIDRRTARVSAEHLSFQEAFIKASGFPEPRPAGHLYFAHKEQRLTLSDQVVRYMLGPSPEPPGRPSFARLLADIDGQGKPVNSTHIAWLRPPAGAGTDLFPTLSVMPHDPRAPVDAILPPGWQAVFKNRIVLVGGDFIDRDGHLTPFSVRDGERMPGVMVHAQILAQLRDGRTVQIVPPAIELVLLVLVAGLGFWLGLRFRLRSGEIVEWAIGVTAVVLSGVALYALSGIIIPSATVFLAWIAGIFGASQIARVERLLTGSKSRASAMPGGGA